MCCLKMEPLTLFLDWYAFEFTDVIGTCKCKLANAFCILDVKFSYHFPSRFTRALSAVHVACFSYIRSPDLKNLSIHMHLLIFTNGNELHDVCYSLIRSFRLMPFNLTLNLTHGQVKITILRLKNNVSGDISDAPTFLQPFGCLFRS